MLSGMPQPCRPPCQAGPGAAQVRAEAARAAVERAEADEDVDGLAQRMADMEAAWQVRYPLGCTQRQDAFHACGRRRSLHSFCA